MVLFSACHKANVASLVFLPFLISSPSLNRTNQRLISTAHDVCRLLTNIWGCGCHKPYNEVCKTPAPKCSDSRPGINIVWRNFAILRAKTYFNLISASSEAEPISPRPGELVRFVAPICPACIRKEELRIKRKALEDLRALVSNAEQTHRHSEEAYQILAMDYFRHLSMRDKLDQEGMTKLPYKLFIEPRAVTLDAWREDWTKAESIVQRAFHLTQDYSISFETVNSLMDEADKVMLTIHYKLQMLEVAIDLQLASQ
jgi:hypothetical protein